MTDCLLALNAGSSSLKYALYLQAGSGWVASERGCIEQQTLDTALQEVMARLRLGGRQQALRGIGHRVVHGGTRFVAPALVTPAVLAGLRDLVPLAPLHQPQNLAVIEAMARELPGVPQVACFDTAFHHDWPAVAALVPLPGTMRERGVRRYGFHGLSCEYIAARLPQLAPRIAAGRVLVAHLGNGASLTALRAGRSVDASFGFTALDGLCMGTRPGALDPGVVLYLFQQLGMSADDVEHLLYRRSGLLGISGLSSDMRELLASQEPAAALAVDYFVYRAAREIGGLAAVLGGVDALVFTAGIGEHSATIRARIGAACRGLGIGIDPALNAAGGPCISAGASRVETWVIPTDEEAMVASHLVTVLGLGGPESFAAGSGLSRTQASTSV